MESKKCTSNGFDLANAAWMSLSREVTTDNVAVVGSTVASTTLHTTTTIAPSANILDMNTCRYGVIATRSHLETLA
jgi:hypothetical protein